MKDLTEEAKRIAGLWMEEARNYKAMVSNWKERPGRFIDHYGTWTNFQDPEEVRRVMEFSGVDDIDKYKRTINCLLDKGRMYFHPYLDGYIAAVPKEVYFEVWFYEGERYRWSELV